MSSASPRGALVVVEGLDRSGKSSQCQILVDHLNQSGSKAQYVKFPDRSTPTGKMINSYLTGSAQQDDHSIHLLFSANRWEAIQSILQMLEFGMNIIIDRYSFSGAVYSAAKDNPNLGLDWAWACEVGLPKPDLVLFLDLSSEEAARRGGYGEERYETQQMQSRVRALFQDLFKRLPNVNLKQINAGCSIDDVATEIRTTFGRFVEQAKLERPPEKLQTLSA
ncbi:Thymidylate kinase [Cyphellophora attinorum]|uniref:Thymidylate kinase n=1 Tax=Cyphellophora attinorum TaxID=1664694 RepID=A0A0N0NNZ0_9EURO|nr:Thymidylate kinase [Phialophora attinorum]KPI42141.1 Thymidylate kinase [Phialophora attinorum]